MKSIAHSKFLRRQDYFKNLTSLDIRTDIYQDEMQRIQDEILPFGFISTEDNTSSFVDESGTSWKSANPEF